LVHTVTPQMANIETLFSQSLPRKLAKPAYTVYQKAEIDDTAEVCGGTVVLHVRYVPLYFLSTVASLMKQDATVCTAVPGDDDKAPWEHGLFLKLRVVLNVEQDIGPDEALKVCTQAFQRALTRAVKDLVHIEAALPHDSSL
jgi:hypothetical protein